MTAVICLIVAAALVAVAWAVLGLDDARHARTAPRTTTDPVAEARATALAVRAGDGRHRKTITEGDHR